jgi:endo-1,4-beta-D-glucanase Y
MSTVFRYLILALALALAVLAVVPWRPALAQESRAPARPLVSGLLSEAPLWKAYQSRFVLPSGRVVDTGNKGISHSEGQGYGMLLSLAAGDEAAFARIWSWTRANLMVRNDHLAAWRWEPDKRPAVADLNDAADADLLMAWALAEAGEAWHKPAYTLAARSIALDVGRRLIIQPAAGGPLLLPGTAGFGVEDRRDGPVVNLSYWVFPALERLGSVAPEIDWGSLRRAGFALAMSARMGPASLPPDWIGWRDRKPVPAEGFPAKFGYDAIRVPLYLAWTGADPALLAPYAVLAQSGEAGPPLVDLATGQASGRLAGKGYRAVTDLAACAADPARKAPGLLAPDLTEDYYPATLALLSLVAARARQPSCVAS